MRKNLPGLGRGPIEASTSGEVVRGEKRKRAVIASDEEEGDGDESDGDEGDAPIVVTGSHGKGRKYNCLFFRLRLYAKKQY